LASTGAGAGIVTLTAVLQAGERLATFFCRQLSASLPPGVTPEHFDMKSERQAERMALCCSVVGCALVVLVSAANASMAKPGKSVARKPLLIWLMSFPLAACRT
jgi:hypothetical protein